MAIAPTATDMPQNKLYENDNLGTAEVVRGGRLTTGEYQICCATRITSSRLPVVPMNCSNLMKHRREMAMALIDHPACPHGISRLRKPRSGIKGHPSGNFSDAAVKSFGIYKHRVQPTLW